MSPLLNDLRYALRSLLRSPGFAAVAVLTLALGIGANTAIFSVVNGVLVKPLPYRSPDGLVDIASQFPSLGFDRFWISPPEYMELQERSRSFSVIGAYRTGAASVQTSDQPLRVTSAIATAELFEALGVSALHGRTFTKEEDRPDGELVVVLSHGLWSRGFGADPSLVGRTVQVNGQARTVVGVMPPGFDLDDAGVEVWTPVQLDPANRQNRGSHFLLLVGRLAPGVTLEQARGEMETLLRRWPEENPGTHTPNPEGHRMVLEPLQERMVGGVRTALYLLLGAVGFVLLIACANVGNLMLARSEGRQREVAVRVSMGAGRGRLMRQFLTEGVVLSLAGGAAGLALAWLGLRTLVAASPGSIPRLAEIGLDGPVLLFTLGVAVLTGLLFGMAPVLHLTSRAVGSALREGGLRATPGSARARLRRVLVVSEVALAVVLVAGSGLLIRSFGALQDVDPGFRSGNLLTFQLFLPAQGYPTAGDQAEFLRNLQERLRSVPGVQGVAAMSGLPPRRDVNANDTQFEGIEQTPDGPPHNVDYYQTVTTDYLATMGIPVVEGRGFSIQDDGASTPVALVNETLARVFYPDGSPLGRRLRPPPFNDQTPWLTIVGVVRDVKQGGLDQPTGTELYFHYPQVAAAGFAPRQVNLVVRTGSPPSSLVGALRREVWSLDPTLPLANVQTMDENLAGSLARPRFLALLLGLFAAVALVLAAVGTYGVMAYSVAERRREIGIRMAMGAEAGRVRGMVLRQGGSMAAVGLLVGVAAALGLTRLMESLLFGITPTDLPAQVLAPAILALVALAACWVPAVRATRVDPVVVLREE